MVGVAHVPWQAKAGKLQSSDIPFDNKRVKNVVKLYERECWELLNESWSI